MRSRRLIPLVPVHDRDRDLRPRSATAIRDRDPRSAIRDPRSATAIRDRDRDHDHDREPRLRPRPRLRRRLRPGERLLPFILCTLALSIHSTATAAAELHAGVARVDITPDWPVRLSGYAARSSVAEGVEDRLQARALAIRDGAGVFTVLVSIDSIVIPHHVREAVMGQIRDRLAVYRPRLVISSTHSHCAPQLDNALENLFTMTPDEEASARRATKMLIERVVSAVETAAKAVEPVTLHFGKGSAAFARNRRPQSGPVDHELPVLAVLGSDGKPRAVLFNYACHATTLFDTPNRISGDWPGAAARAVEAALPGAVAFPLIGCGADADPSPRGRIEHVLAHGEEIGRAVTAVLAGPLTVVSGSIDAQLRYVHLPLEAPPTAEELRGQLASSPRPEVRRLARKLLDRLEREGALPRTVHYPIQVLRVGTSLTMVFLAGEVVVDYTLRLRRELPNENLWVTAYSNDVPCYIPSRRVLAEGGYEAGDAMVWYSQPARFDPAVEETIVSTVLDLVRSAGGAENAERRLKPPPPLEPADALKAMRVVDGFRVELAAAEPRVTDPVAIAFDADGRIYAAEMRDYPLGPPPGRPVDGRVRLLEDRDLDGDFESATIFAEGTPYANGIACSREGVFVSAQTEILYLRDLDNDGVADIKQTVYQGFETANSQHLMNSLEWGLDNWLYLNGGDSARVRSPLKDIPVVSGSGISFRFRPDDLRIEATSGYTGGFGITFTESGERIVCENQVHGIHVVMPRALAGRNPEHIVEATLESLSNHGADIFPVAAQLERFNDPWDAGRFSAACGVHVYAGDRFPAAFRGNLFSCDPVSNVVHRDVLEPRGATLVARRAEERREFLASTDPWFRPVNCATGPDGCLYIVDMYREVIEHPEWIPAHIQKLFDLRSGMNRGRIWRVTHEASPRRKSDKLSLATVEALVRALASPDRPRRQTAQRLLVERHSSRAALVESTLRQSRDPLARLHALWTLEGMKALDADALTQTLGDADPRVRAAGAQVALGRLEETSKPLDAAARTLDAAARTLDAAARTLDAGSRKAVAATLAALAEDVDARVRFHVALALGALSPEEREAPLLKIALRDCGDRWTREAVLSALRQSPVRLIEAIAREPRSKPGRGELLGALAALGGRRGDAKEAQSVLAALLGSEKQAGEKVRDPAIVTAVGSFLGALGPVQRDGLFAPANGSPTSTPADVREELELLLRAQAERALDAEVDLAERVRAIELVAQAGLAAGLPVLKAFLTPSVPGDLQRRAIAGLARITQPEARRAATELLIATFAQANAALRAEILNALFPDAERAARLLEGIEKSEIRAAEIGPAHRKALLESRHPGLADRAKKALAEVASNPDRAAVVAEYQRAIDGIKPAADLARGHALYRKHCITCHRVGTEGAFVGPDLAAMRARERDALLVDILDPSRAVAPELLNYALITRDGKAYSGLLVGETPSSVTIKAAEAKTQTVLRKDVAELRSTGLSLMPDGLEREMKPDELRDLIAWIKGSATGTGAGR